MRPNLRSFRSPDGTCISWQFIHDSDAELNCEGEEVWTGQMADLVQFSDSEVVIDPNSTVTDSIEIDQVEDIAEIKVNVDISTSFANDLVIELASPGGITVVDLTTDFSVGVGDFNLFFSDTGLNHGQLPPNLRELKKLNVGEKPEVNANVGAEMLLAPEAGSLADFNGGSTPGKWNLTVMDALGNGATLNSWGIVVNFAATPPNVAGTWVVEIFAKKDFCDDLVGQEGEEDIEQMFVLVEQNGADVTIKNGDGSPLENVLGGVIQGTLDGTMLSITFSEDVGDVITTFVGILVFSDFLNGIRPQQLSSPAGIEWFSFLIGDEEPLCEGLDFWNGRKIDALWTPELIACSGSEEIGPQVGGGPESVFLEVDDDIEIGEIEVLTDVRSTFFQNIDEISVTGPEEVTVTLYSPEQLEFELFNRLNVMWADRESLAYARFPPIDFSSFGGRMEVFDEAPLSQFQGTSTEGEWRLDIISEAGLKDLAVDWCIVVNDELPPQIFEECSENTPLDYESEKNKDESFLTDTLQVDAAVQIAGVEVSTELTQSFVENLVGLRVTSPLDTTVELAGKFLGEDFDTETLDVIWSDHGVPYDQFPKKGGTTFGGRMQPVSIDDGGLSIFEGEPSAGEWTLNLESFDSGTLDDWCVIIEEDL